MKELRPRGMTQGAFAELLKGAGFEACSKAAVSLAERPKDSGVQFTPEARKAAQELLKSTSEERDGDAKLMHVPYGRTENRKNGRKTTVWLDDELRAWVEKKAYLTDSCVGELIRKILRQAMENDAAKKYNVERKTLADIVCEAIENAASDVGASEAAGERTR